MKILGLSGETRISIKTDPFPHILLGEERGLGMNDRAARLTRVPVHESLLVGQDAWPSITRASFYRKSGVLILGPEVDQSDKRAILCLRHDGVKRVVGQLTLVASGVCHSRYDGASHDDVFIIEPETSIVVSHYHRITRYRQGGSPAGVQWVTDFIDVTFDSQGILKVERRKS